MIRSRQNSMPDGSGILHPHMAGLVLVTGQSGTLSFCPGEKCPHYGHDSKKYPRKCYYSPQCWRGFLDVFFHSLKVTFDRKVAR